MVTWEELRDKAEVYKAIEKAEENKKHEKNVFRIKFWDRVIMELKEKGGIK